jgi:hypothetical protein
MKRLTLSLALGLIGLLAMPLASATAVVEEDKYTLFGTAARAKSPSNPVDQVITINTTPTNSVGGATRRLNQTVHSLDGLISVDYFLVNGKICVGGSPRIQLAVDTDGDGLTGGPSDPGGGGNAFGYQGTVAFGGACLGPDRWAHEDFTDDVPRWDLTQFGGGFTHTWDSVEAFFALRPHEQVLRGTLVEDACSFAAANCGRTFDDTLKIGNRTLENWLDTRR